MTRYSVAFGDPWGGTDSIHHVEAENEDAAITAALKGFAWKRDADAPKLIRSYFGLLMSCRVTVST